MSETISALRAAELLADRNDAPLYHHARDLAFSVILGAAEGSALRELLAQAEQARDALSGPAGRALRYEQALREHRALCDQRDRTHCHAARAELSRRVTAAHFAMMDALRALHRAAGHE